MPPETPYVLSPLELATGMVLGTDPSVSPLLSPTPGFTARAALEGALVRALQRRPCLVSFSGGRDSSAVLALAAHVARQEGLPLPIPITMRFPSCAESDETSWQELVVRHLQLPDWVRLEFDDELDVIGPNAQAVLARYGVLWPFNVHSHLPLAERAAGGTLVTGAGGDELLVPRQLWRRVNQVLARQVRPAPKDVLRIAAAYGPRPLRRRVASRQLAWEDLSLPWLRFDAARQLHDDVLLELDDEPVRWDASIDRVWWRSNYRRVSAQSLSLVGDMHSVAVESPLADPVVLAAIAREGGRAGFSSRTIAMKHLFNDLLPVEILERTSKALFGGSFWNQRASAFAASWDGTGVDPDVVDVDALRERWARSGSSNSDARTFGLLQSAWLASSRSAIGRFPGCRP